MDWIQDTITLWSRSRPDPKPKLIDPLVEHLDKMVMDGLELARFAAALRNQVTGRYDDNVN